jgi:hypothetical protein
MKRVEAAGRCFRAIFLQLPSKKKLRRVPLPVTELVQSLPVKRSFVRESMTKQATTILSGLVLLTIGGLVLVSNFISEPKPANEAMQAAAFAPGASGSPQLLPTPTTRPISSAGQWEADLKRAQEQLKTLSDAIKNNDWGIAEGLFVTFELKDRRLPTPQLRHPDISPILQDFFDLYVVQLERAIREKQAKPAQIAVNQMIGIVGEAKARFVNRTAPVEIQRLHHLVRELAVWTDVGDERMLRTRIAALREAWNDVSSLVRTRKQGEAVAEKFASLLTAVSAADTPGKLVPLLPKLDAQLDQLDGLFQSGTPRDGASPDNER